MNDILITALEFPKQRSDGTVFHTKTPRGTDIYHLRKMFLKLYETHRNAQIYEEALYLLIHLHMLLKGANRNILSQLTLEEIC